MERNIRLYPWFEFFRSLIFWQATWFLYIQQELSAAAAILLYAIYDVATTVLEVPSGYMSDRVGRRPTLICAALAMLGSMLLLGLGGSFAAFALAQVLGGVGAAFVSGTNSALLYESLEAEGRAAEVEPQNLRAWRMSFLALALSAVIGGVLALVWPPLPFVTTAVAFCALLGIALRFAEPPHASASGSEWERLSHLRGYFTRPALRWIFLIGVLMYGFSHIPFVFGQPFIADALSRAGLPVEAPLVSGVVTAVMMALSLVVSLFAPSLRARIGLGAMLLIAFGMQAGLALALAVSGSVLAIGFLLLRMVPDSLSTPFVIAYLQPHLDDDSRATFLSMKSLAGRLLFAATLALAAASTSAVGEMTRAELQAVLMAYAIGGLMCLAALAVTLRRTKL